MNEQGHIKDFPSDEKAVEAGYAELLTPQEERFLKDVPEEDRKDILHKYRQDQKLKALNRAEGKQHRDGQYTRKKFRRPSDKKKKMIKKSKKSNRR